MRSRNCCWKNLQVLLADKSSAGVTNSYGEPVISKGGKFSSKVLNSVDYQNVHPLGWTGEAETDDQVNQMLHNYNIKYNEELGRYKSGEIQPVYR